MCCASLDIPWIIPLAYRPKDGQWIWHVRFITAHESFTIRFIVSSVNLYLNFCSIFQSKFNSAKKLNIFCCYSVNFVFRLAQYTLLWMLVESNFPQKRNHIQNPASVRHSHVVISTAQPFEIPEKCLLFTLTGNKRT